MREEESNWFPDWEEALPSPEELIPSSQSLITPQPLPQPTPTQANSSPVFTGAEQARPRRRFVWTPELHKRFVDAVEQLGINRALVKPIMELMNVEGLTRRDVAIHYQRYRHRQKLLESYYLIRPSSLHLHGQEDLESGARRS